MQAGALRSGQACALGGLRSGMDDGVRLKEGQAAGAAWPWSFAPCQALVLLVE